MLNYAEPRLSQQSDTIEPLVAQVSKPEIYRHIEVLSSSPRDTLERQQYAANYITNTLQGFGYEPTLDPISVPSNSPGNIIARLPGRINPETKFIIGAHYDSASIPESYTGSPGADDNASAVAGALEIARVLEDFQPDATIEFVFFGAEEVGLLGSRQYAAEANAEEVPITGMFSLEMIGYFSDRPNSQDLINSFDLDFSKSPPQQVPPGSGTPILRVSEENRTIGNFIAAVGNTQSAELLRAFQITSNEFVSNLDVITGETTFNGLFVPGARASDHAPFWDTGYEALMVTDTAYRRNPNYHTPRDTIDTLNIPFAQQVTQAALATAIITTSVLVVDGTGGKDNLFGTSKADKINGNDGKDILTGLGGNDSLNGGNGKDILIGVDPNAANPGYREIDILNGGNGNDVFVLGDEDKVYYDNPYTQGLKDYAIITDYSRGDVIQLKGLPSDYMLVKDFTVGSRIGTSIFVSDHNEYDLIGLVEGVAGLSLNSNSFQFV